MKRLMFILTIMLSFLFSANSYGRINERTYIPPQAFQYKATIKSEIETYFPDLPIYEYVPSLIEHESCTSLLSKKCWSPASQLKSAREEGAGFFQITKAYDKEGNIRFDNVKEMRNKYKEDLAELSWKTIYTRSDLQIRSGVLMLRDMYERLYTVPDNMERLKMVDSAYNGGERDLKKSRQKCYLTKGCNVNIWFDNVEDHCVKSKKILYDVRNACDINLFHVHNVFLDKLPKYTEYYKF